MEPRPVGRVRSPIVVVLGYLFTFGIYAAYWFFSVAKEVDAYRPEGPRMTGLAKAFIALVLAIALAYVVVIGSVLSAGAGGSEALVAMMAAMGLVFFLIIPLVVVSILYWARLWSFIAAEEQATDVRNPLSVGLMFVLLLVPIVNIVGMVYVPWRTQSGLNGIWQRQTAALGGGTATPT